MKTVIIILLIGGIIIFMASGCWNYSADSAPGLAVYKTMSDYFYNVSMGINKNGELYGFPSYYDSRSNRPINPRIKITDDDTVYAWRAKLINGYIISEEIGDNSVFVDFTHKEYLKHEIENPEISGVAPCILSEHILDNDPFIELFIDKNRPRKYSLIGSLSDTILINQMIRDGELGKYFERVK